MKAFLLHPSSVDSINYIQMVMDAFEVNLECDINGVWYYQDEKGRVPANSERVKSFLGALSQAIKGEEIHSQDFNSYTGEGRSFYLNFMSNSGESQEIRFGKTDFSGSKRYVFWGDSILLCENVLEVYLNVDSNFWCEKLIVSPQIKVFNTEDVQRVIVNGKRLSQDEISSFSNSLKSLRYSEVCSFDDFSLHSYLGLENNVIVELGDKSEIQIQGYETGNDLDILAVNLTGAHNTPDYCVYVSRWTFNKLFGKE